MLYMKMDECLRPGMSEFHDLGTHVAVVECLDRSTAASPATWMPGRVAVLELRNENEPWTCNDYALLGISHFPDGLEFGPSYAEGEKFFGHYRGMGWVVTRGYVYGQKEWEKDQIAVACKDTSQDPEGMLEAIGCWLFYTVCRVRFFSRDGLGGFRYVGTLVSSVLPGRPTREDRADYLALRARDFSGVSFPEYWLGASGGLTQAAASLSVA